MTQSFIIQCDGCKDQIQENFHEVISDYSFWWSWERQPVHSKGNQSWVFIGRTDAKAETPILWPPHAKSWLIGKDSDAGRDWGQEEKGTTEDGMAGWHHQLNGHEFEWTLGVGDGQGGLACCYSWHRKESDTTEWMNWTITLKESTFELDIDKEFNFLSY